MTAKLPQTLQRHLPELVDGLRPHLVPNVTAYQALADALDVSVSLVSQRTQAERRRRTEGTYESRRDQRMTRAEAEQDAADEEAEQFYAHVESLGVAVVEMPADEEARLRAALEAAARGDVS